jgi:periplasmic nitrate reductase NapD
MGMDRRTFLRGGIDNTHISSLVVHCRPEVVERLIVEINALEFAQVPEHSELGKLVVLLQTPGEGPIMDCISTIQDMRGVLGTAMVYHEIDSESEETS